jgi:hypothetical protein
LHRKLHVAEKIVTNLRKIEMPLAQVEREVTGERIRDKFAASKKRGMWMGGPVPLVRALARAHAMRLKLESGEATSVPDLMVQFGLAESHVRKTLPIGFLAPDLMAQVLDGRQPARLQLGHICDGKLPLDLAEQRALFAELQR